MPLPTRKIFGGNPVTVADPIPVLLVDANGNPLVGLPTALGQAAAAASMPVVLNTENPLGDKADAAAQSGTVSAIALLKWLNSVLKAEDSAHASGDFGPVILVRRSDTAASSADTDGDYAIPGLDSTGRLWVNTELPDANTLAGAGLPNIAAPQVNAMIAALGGTTLYPLNSLNGASDGNATTYVALVTTTYGLKHNGTTWDRDRNNVEATALASAARTATTNSPDIVNYNGRGVVVILDITAFAATPVLTLSIEGKDPVSGGYYTILIGAAINVAGASRNIYVVYPGITETANVDVSFPLPRTFHITVTHGDADSVTYSVGYANIL